MRTPAGRDMERDLLVEEIKRKLEDRNVLLVALTGWGKTYLMMRLAIELAREGRVALLAPTLTLLMKKWLEFRQILLSLQSPPRAILTAGAGQYCVFGYQVPQRFCRRCKLYRSTPPVLQLEERAVTFEEIDAMTPEDVCGYWVQEASLTRYDIVAGHYGRLQKIAKLAHYILIDEAHEFYLPHISSYPLDEIAELLGVSAEELNSIAVIKELIAQELSRDLDPKTEDRLYSLSSALRKTCWIEAQELHCMDLYDMPRGVRIFAATATPPPGWPPEGWGEKIEIEPRVRPRAFVEPEARFYFRDRYEGAALQLHYVVKWLRENFGVRSIAVFAISSLQHVLAYSLPPGVELYPCWGLDDAWGKMRVGVDLTHDATVVFWPSLHISARRRLRAENRDPDIVELIEAIQVAGRILRPSRPEERYEDVLRKKIIVFADARYWRFREYLQRFFDVQELRLPQ
jgi:hypothetical protein